MCFINFSIKILTCMYMHVGDLSEGLESDNEPNPKFIRHHKI